MNTTSPNKYERRVQKPVNLDRGDRHAREFVQKIHRGKSPAVLMEIRGIFKHVPGASTGGTDRYAWCERAKTSDRQQSYTSSCGILSPLIYRHTTSHRLNVLMRCIVSS